MCQGQVFVLKHTMYLLAGDDPDTSASRITDLNLLCKSRGQIYRKSVAPIFAFYLIFFRKRDYLPSPISMFTKMQIITNMVHVPSFFHDKSNVRYSAAINLFSIVSFLSFLCYQLLIKELILTFFLE